MLFSDWLFVIIVEGYIGLFSQLSHSFVLELDTYKVICVKIEGNEVF